jgi:uncharacterized protein YkwD
MSQGFQRLTAFAVIAALVLPLSAFAENRSRARTDLERLAADLERALGRGSVVIEEDVARASARDGGERAEARSTPAAQTLVAAMNRQRAAHGLGPLRLESRLTMAANDRVQDMLEKRYFNHVSPDGIQPFTWVSQRGYRYRTVGENLALGYRGAAVVDGWMRSPGHRENILQSSFNEVGIAIADGSPARGYRGPLVVALYGSR